MAGALAPALLKRTSRRPKPSPVAANIALTAAESLTSMGTQRILPPGTAADAPVRSSASARRPASTNEYPADPSARETARPIPLPAPVTSAILPWLDIGLRHQLIADKGQPLPIGRPGGHVDGPLAAEQFRQDGDLAGPERHDAEHRSEEHTSE